MMAAMTTRGTMTAAAIAPGEMLLWWAVTTGTALFVEVAVGFDVVATAAAEVEGDVVDAGDCVACVDWDCEVEVAVVLADVLDGASDVEVTSGRTELDVKKSGRTEEELEKSSKVKAREERAKFWDVIVVGLV